MLTQDSPPYQQRESFLDPRSPLFKYKSQAACPEPRIDLHLHVISDGAPKPIAAEDK